MLNVKAVLAVQGLLTHLHTPVASCEILKTERLPLHSYHILKLRQSNNTAQKNLAHEWDKQTPSKTKNSSSPCLHHQTRLIWPPTHAIQASTSAFHPHTHNDVIYLWLSTRKLAANGVSESTQIWQKHWRTAELHMTLGNGAALPKWQKHAVELLISHWRSKVMQYMNKCVNHKHIRDTATALIC